MLRFYKGTCIRRLMVQTFVVYGIRVHPPLHSSISMLYRASGEMSPRVLRSAALYALRNECVSSPYSDCASMCS